MTWTAGNKLKKVERRLKSLPADVKSDKRLREKSGARGVKFLRAAFQEMSTTKGYSMLRANGAAIIGFAVDFHCMIFHQGFGQGHRHAALWAFGHTSGFGSFPFTFSRRAAGVHRLVVHFHGIRVFGVFLSRELGRLALGAVGGVRGFGFMTGARRATIIRLAVDLDRRAMHFVFLSRKRHFTNGAFGIGGLCGLHRSQSTQA